jgi:hypothetical protein
VLVSDEPILCTGAVKNEGSAEAPEWKMLLEAASPLSAMREAKSTRVDINLNEPIYLGEAPLGGVKDQNGFLAYSLVRDYPARRPSLADPLGLKSKRQQPPRGFIKYKNSSSSTYSENQLSFDGKSGGESPFRKNKHAELLESKTDECNRMIDELFHEILEEQLFNQRAWNKIQENEIFQLRYKQRIDMLLGIDNNSFVHTTTTL